MSTLELLLDVRQWPIISPVVRLLWLVLSLIFSQCWCWIMTARQPRSTAHSYVQKQSNVIRNIRDSFACTCMRIHYLCTLCGGCVQPIWHSLTVWLISEAQLDVWWGNSVGVSRAWLDHSGLQMQTTGRSITNTACTQHHLLFIMIPFGKSPSPCSQKKLKR